MKVIKNGTLTKQGSWVCCYKCWGKEGWVLQPGNWDLWYCWPCIEKAFSEVQKETNHE